jgi:surfeit locus 1 family protein
VLLENRKHNGVAGYHVYTPMQLQGTDKWVMVNRGWIAQGADRSLVPPLPGSQDEITIQGRVANVPSVGIRLGEPAAERRWPMRVIYLDLEWLEQQTGLSLLPYVVYQTGDNPYGLQRDWHEEWYSKTSMTPEKHMGYAVQWFSMVVLVVIMFFIFSLKRDQ